MLRWPLAGALLLVAGCTSGQYGSQVREAAEKTQGGLIGLTKSALIERFGVPEGSVSSTDAPHEYWIYSTERYRYLLVLGRKQSHVVLLRMVDGRVGAARVVDQGSAREVATRGWDYVNMLFGQ